MNFLQKEQENARFLATNWIKRGSLEKHGCPKIEDLGDEEDWICWSYPFRHKTTILRAERKAKLLGNWILRHIVLLNLQGEMYC